MKALHGFVITFGLILFSAQVVNADPPAVIERTANMTVVESRYGFEGVSEVSLTLSKSEEAASFTSLLLKYLNEVRVLEITNTATDEEGCTTYSAQIHFPEEDGSNHGERFSVYLTDHTTCASSNNGPIWVASVRHGYGWCGTQDAVMELEGTPNM